jgi:hypothetical protein
VRVAVLAAIVAVLVSAAAAWGALDARRPTLRVVDLSPLTVRGSNFAPGERVKLLVNAGGPLVRAAKAGPRGGFLKRLGVRVDPTGCGVVVQAIGRAGSRALVDTARPGCDARP